ncbi:uncharacterized protein BXZ73DRAFT_99157 [Epithele typhae]|uniref:uncharacterized protein n=1 Tax=Epithele typhae TaxID=378194 RepID=UPI002007BF7E|nr:uncharacterized protein BXZ73DRAFT_99157 [Epithele typhae]KAH9940159.1 hypothetical protein BXZ73DRAFT_99157 [Epithele typhae]
MERTLPPEICDFVVDEVHTASTVYNTSKTLKACALVCRQWRDRAQFHLFSTIDLLIGDVLGPGKRKTKPADNLREVLSARPDLASRVTSLKLNHIVFSNNDAVWKKEDLQDWPSQFPKLREIYFLSPDGNMSHLPLKQLVSALLHAPSTLEHLTLGGVDIPANSVRKLSGIKRKRTSPTIRHLTAFYDFLAYNRGNPGVIRPDIGILLDALVHCGLISRPTLLTLDLPHYWDISEPWDRTLPDDSLNFANLETFGVMLCHSQDDDPDYDDGTHIRTRELMDALASCSRLRVLHITYGEPEFRTNDDRHLLRHKYLSDALIRILVDHFSQTPVPHPGLEELKFTITYWIKDVERVWTPAIPELARVLCDRARYPVFRRVSVTKAVTEDPYAREEPPDEDTVCENCKRVFAAFEAQGVELEVEMEVMHTDPYYAVRAGEHLHYDPEDVLEPSDSDSDSD